MKTGGFSKAIISTNRAFDILEVTKSDFGDDYDIVLSKFCLLRGNLYYISS